MSDVLIEALETARHDFNQIISETDMKIKMAIAQDAAIDITEALEAHRKTDAMGGWGPIDNTDGRQLPDGWTAAAWDASKFSLQPLPDAPEGVG